MTLVFFCISKFKLKLNKILPHASLIQILFPSIKFPTSQPKYLCLLLRTMQSIVNSSVKDILWYQTLFESSFNFIKLLLLFNFFTWHFSIFMVKTLRNFFHFIKFISQIAKWDAIIRSLKFSQPLCFRSSQWERSS